MKRGFTLVELIFASTISIVVFTGVFISLSGVWQMLKTSNGELDLLLHARAVRERLLVRVDATHDGLLGPNAQILAGGTATARISKDGFEVAIARSERKTDGSVVQDTFYFPGDYATKLVYLKGTTAADVTLTGTVLTRNLCDRVVDSAFLPSAKATGKNVPKLVQLNLFHHLSAKDQVYEDHPVFYMENGAWNN